MNVLFFAPLAVLLSLGGTSAQLDGDAVYDATSGFRCSYWKYFRVTGMSLAVKYRCYRQKDKFTQLLQKLNDNGQIQEQLSKCKDSGSFRSQECKLAQVTAKYDSDTADTDTSEAQSSESAEESQRYCSSLKWTGFKCKRIEWCEKKCKKAFFKRYCRFCKLVKAKYGRCCTSTMTQAEPTTTPTTTTTTTTTTEPTTQEPTTQEPTTQEPTTQEPTTQEPTTQEPTTQEPTTQEPTTQEPTTQEPTTQEPTTQEPTTQEPTTQEPTTQEPTTQEPTTQEPTTQEPDNQETALAATIPAGINTGCFASCVLDTSQEMCLPGSQTGMCTDGSGRYVCCTQ